MSNEKYGVAIDIGTTTLAAALIDGTGGIIKELSRPNSQIKHGRDVMSRIRAASDGAEEELKALIQADLTDMITQLLKEDRSEPAENIVMAVAGNTAMLHILNGYDCSGLGRHPYTPVTLSCEIHAAADLFPELPAGLHKIKTIVLPGISAFVGADITAGLYAADVLKKEVPKPLLFLDLGTNGEMALVTREGDKARIAVCSTAAGPVFEGAGIKHGMRGVPGAISDVFISGSPSAPSVRCQVIGGGEATGICGSGVLEAVSELARLRLIDKDGLLKEPWFSEGFPLADGIRLYQEDIREVQLAKAAIRAGAEILPLACGIPRSGVDTVLVAGAFGKALPFSRLGPLGLLPPELLPKCRSLGNTSLYGASKLLTEVINGREEEALASLRHIGGLAKEIPLAGRRDFEACYTAMMGF